MWQFCIKHLENNTIFSLHPKTNFFTFFKLYKWYQIAQRITNLIWLNHQALTDLASRDSAVKTLSSDVSSNHLKFSCCPCRNFVPGRPKLIEERNMVLRFVISVPVEKLNRRCLKRSRHAVECSSISSSLMRFSICDLVDPFHAIGVFLYPLKTSENQRFSDLFRRYRKTPVAWNGSTC